MRKVALRFGVEPSTISRWCKKDPTGGWREIPTLSSAPKRHPNALPREIVSAIIARRVARKRCGQVIYRELKAEGISVSLCSVQRTLKRCHLLKERSPWKRPHDTTSRPEISRPGSLLEADTVHIALPDGGRLYVYTVIDLYSRWAYAEVSARITTRRSAAFIARAQQAADFRFEMIQTDHGQEFSIWFTRALWRMRLKHRHSRVRQSNDNAHVERFNRTIQDECFTGIIRSIPTFKAALKKYLPYYNGERLHMGIDYQTPAQMLQRS